MAYIGDRNVRTVKEAEDYIKEKAFPQLKAYGYTNNVIIRKEDNQKLGTCGLYHREGLDSIDIGFAFLPEYENKGFAFEASSRLMLAAKHDYGMTELSGFTLEENTSSRILLERLGFNLNGTAHLENDPVELLHYYGVLNFDK